MTSHTLTETLDALLDIHSCDSIDGALNGLQVGCADNQREIRTVAVAVDACLESIERAAAARAGMLVVHHGIFWGRQAAVVGSHRARIAGLLEHDIALYAAHLPLDIHPSLGNNIAIAEHLGLTGIEEFGAYKGKMIGYAGTLGGEGLGVDAISDQFLHDGAIGSAAAPLGVLRFGKEKCKRVAIVSGGGNMTLDEAIDKGFDLLITGDAGYASYHRASEEGINVLFAGHYNTETWGVRRIGEYLQKNHGIDAPFIDIPVGL